MKNPPKLELTPEQRKIAEELGRIGGQTRAKRLTPERRQAIARQASRAAALARKKKAKVKKSKGRSPE